MEYFTESDAFYSKSESITYPIIIEDGECRIIEMHEVVRLSGNKTTIYENHQGIPTEIEIRIRKKGKEPHHYIYKLDSMKKIIDIPDEIVPELKILAVKKKKSFKGYIEHLLIQAAKKTKKK